jgi:inosine-uridine nucleoside N-ribohydrolase
MREFNVKLHALSCRAVFEADWEKVITPLDTCGDIVLDGQRFAAIAKAAEASGPASPAGICMDNHLAWFHAVSDWPILKDMDPRQQSSILYDLVAIYLGFADGLLEMERLPIVVTPDGKTVIDDAGSTVNCALNWRDQGAFLDLVTRRLTGIQA